MILFNSADVRTKSGTSVKEPGSKWQLMPLVELLTILLLEFPKLLILLILLSLFDSKLFSFELLLLKLRLLSLLFSTLILLLFVKLDTSESKLTEIVVFVQRGRVNTP